MDDENIYSSIEKLKKEEDLSFSLKNQTADIFFEVLETGFDFLKVKCKLLHHSKTVKLPFVGEHNLINLMSACGCLLAGGYTAENIFSGFEKTHSKLGTYGVNQKNRKKHNDSSFV